MEKLEKYNKNSNEDNYYDDDYDDYDYDYECDELNGVELACFFEYEEEELGSTDEYGLKNEPDYPASWTLMHVYLPDGTDIFGILHDSILESIQECAEEDFDIQRGEF